MSISSLVILKPDYECSKHGTFSIRVERPKEKTPEKSPCPECKKKCPRKEFKIEGGPSLVIVRRSWEEQAGRARANPAEQMKSQLDSVKRAEDARERYGDPRCNFMEGE